MRGWIKFLSSDLNFSATFINWTFKRPATHKTLGNGQKAGEPSKFLRMPFLANPAFSRTKTRGLANRSKVAKPNSEIATFSLLYSLKSLINFQLSANRIYMLAVKKSELKQCNRVLLTLKPENWRIFQNLSLIARIFKHSRKRKMKLIPQIS